MVAIKQAKGNTGRAIVLLVGGHPKIHFVTDSGSWPLWEGGGWYQQSDKCNEMEPKNVCDHIL